MRRIGIDVDNVLYPFADQEFKHLCEEILGHELPPVTRWDFYEDWGLTEEWFSGLMRFLCLRGDLFWTSHNSYALSGFKAQAHIWLRADYEVVLVTNRGDYAKGATEYWLADNRIPYTELVFTHDKTLHDLDVLVDDSPFNLLAADNSGIKTFRWMKPWNVHCPGIPVQTFAGVSRELQTNGFL